MQKRTIYVALPDEGVETWRPVEAEQLSNGDFRILGPVADSEVERWEYPPGSIVETALRPLSEGLALVAVAGVETRAPALRWAADRFNENPLRIALTSVAWGGLGLAFVFLLEFGLDWLIWDRESRFPWSWIPPIMAFGAMAGAAYGLDRRSYFTKDYPVLRTVICAALGWFGLWLVSPASALNLKFGAMWTLGSGVLGYLGFRWARILDWF